MILKLAFQTLFGYKEKDVEIILNIGTLEAMCDGLGIGLHEIEKYSKEDPVSFTQKIFYYGYLTACQKSYKKPKYTTHHALVWVTRLLPSESLKFAKMLGEFYGKVNKVNEDLQENSKKKVK